MQAPFVDPLLSIEQRRSFLPLVGREMEQHALNLVLHTVASDVPQGARAVTISGETGIGKTRLLAEMCWNAQERGFRVLEANAYEAGRMLPYLPFLEALRPVLRSAPLDALRRYVGLTDVSQQHEDVSAIVWAGMPLIAALTRLFPELPTWLHIQLHAETERLQPEQEKFRLLDSIATVLERLSQESPVLLCIDNLQWADSASLELMLYVTVRLRTSRVALVGAMRPPQRNTRSEQSTTEANMTAMRALSELMRHGLLLFLPLAPLSEEAALAHLHVLLPGELPPQVIAALLPWAEGNPFFLEELVRALTLAKQLVLRDGIWHLRRNIQHPLPESIVFAVRQRLQGVSTACLDVLALASLFGRKFPAEALMRAVMHAEIALYSGDIARHSVQSLLDEAERASLITRQAIEDDGRDIYEGHTEMDALDAMTTTTSMQRSYIFCQGIVQEILHTDVPTYRLRGMHKVIAGVLENYYAREAIRHAAELAHHARLGGDEEATLRWSIVAGEEAAKHQAYREAIRQFLIVAKLFEDRQSAERVSSPSAESPNQPTLVQLYLILGELWLKLGELVQATSALQRATELAHTQDADSLLLIARINRMLADVYRLQAKYDLAFAHLQLARDALNEENRQEAISVQAVPWLLGRTIVSATPTANARHLVQEERLQVLLAQAMVALFLHQRAESEEAFWQAHSLAISLGDRTQQAFALHMIGWIRGWGEHTLESLRLQKQANDLYIAIGDPYRAALGDQGLGIIYQALGELEQAQLYTLRGLERARRYGVQRVLGWLYWNQGAMALAQGDWASSESHLQQAEQEAENHADARLKPVVMQSQAVLAFRRGSWREAEQLFQDALQTAMNTEWYVSAVALYGHFLAVTGQHTLARVQLERAAALPEPIGFAGDFYIPFLVEGYVHLNELTRAAAYIERLDKLHNFQYYGTTVARVLGEHALLTAQWERADTIFAEGIHFCRRAKNQPEEAAILYEQARMGVMRNEQAGNVYALCEQARALFLRYEMARAVALVQTLEEGVRQLEQSKTLLVNPPVLRVMVDAQEYDHAPSRAYVHEVALTPREMEVLRLVAEGHTDREVADILVISTRTANRHLSNIFVKLNVPGRAAAVAYAIRHGLV